MYPVLYTVPTKDLNSSLPTGYLPGLYTVFTRYVPGIICVSHLGLKFILTYLLFTKFLPSIYKICKWYCTR